MSPVPNVEETDPFRRLARRLTRAFGVLLAVSVAFGLAGYVATSGAAERRIYQRAEDAPRRRVAIVLRIGSMNALPCAARPKLP